VKKGASSALKCLKLKKLEWWQPFGFLEKAAQRFDLRRHSRENGNPE
jgi:hypothetical protein